MPEHYPDARILVAISTKDHDLQGGIEQLNPILKQILASRGAPLRLPGGAVSENFGRLTFSQTK